jgi:hypothetical protein
LVKTTVSYVNEENDWQNSYRNLVSYEVDLTGLQEGEVYEYRFGLSQNGPWSPVYSFKTAPKTETTTIYLLGDLQVPDGNPASFKLFTNMLDVLRNKNPNGQLMVQTGDLVHIGGRTELWDEVLTNVYRDMDLLSANLLGNHEVKKDMQANHFTHFFNLPENGKGAFKETNYSFDYGDVHIAVLNSVQMTNNQLIWLEHDMRSTDKKWKIVMGHYPYYGGKHSNDPGMGTARAIITKKMQQLGICLYIGGHDHVYKRTTIHNGLKNTSQMGMQLGTTFMTLGSSGPKFYENVSFPWDHIVFDKRVQTGAVLETNNETLTVKTYDRSGKIIDEFMLTPREH